MPSAWTFQPTLSSQQAWTLKSETHTLLCAGLEAVCCHLGPEPRIRWEKRWQVEKGERKKNQWVPQLHSWLKKLKLAISFHFKGTLLKPFLFSMTCTGKGLPQSAYRYCSNSLLIFPTGFICDSTLEHPTLLWRARRALLVLPSEEDICELSRSATYCTWKKTAQIFKKLKIERK